jgi:phosphomannomutase
VLGGRGTYEKILYQMGGKENEHIFDYIFSENGLVTYKKGELFHENDIKDEISEEKIQKIVDFVLMYIACLKLPFKRGNFINFRKGMLYVTPIGGDCSEEERAFFVKWDEENKVREKMIKSFSAFFHKDDVDVKMGGEIGIGLHPKGWDKSYILRLIDIEEYEKVYFFGDRCEANGNDYPLYSNPHIEGENVKNPEDTLKKLEKF